MIRLAPLLPPSAALPPSLHSSSNMKLLSVFFLLVLLALAFALNEGDSCEFDDDCDGGQHCTSYFRCKHGRRGRRGFVDDDDSYQCNPKCAEGLACYHGICVDGN